MVSLCGRGFESLQLHSLYNKEGVSQTYDTPSFFIYVGKVKTFLWKNKLFLLSNIEKLSRKYGIILIFCGKVYIVIFFCIYKISYQILFGFTVEYVLIRKKFFMKKKRLKKQKIAEWCFYFEFQVVVAVVGIKWHRRGKAKNAD